MKAIALAALILWIFTSAVHAGSGKLLLKNGHTVKGDIRRIDNGGYWVTDRNGSVRYEKSEIRKVVMFSSRDPVSESFITSLKITPGQPLAGYARSNTHYDSLIHKEAKTNRLDPNLVKAVIRAESNYNSNDVSSKGACGLMQLMPQTAKLMGVKSIFAPDQNIKAGTMYLRYMIDEFDGDLEMAIAAYNAGPGAVRKYGKIPPYKETRNYVKNVLKYYRGYGSSKSMYSFTDERGCLNIYNDK